eukprot:TRINITY_DN1751_c0_g1_i1.p3 TRINITY_DN1751_c0_g1~~TRINITY_DN1751_c0_g1_i1.p3  ORF type:complete len:121 (-),score=21.08 TRINITY_DN1751_c0_g1_i1:386-748(-)
MQWRMGSGFIVFFFFSSRRRHTRSCLVSWARRCVQETGINAEYMGNDRDKEAPKADPKPQAKTSAKTGKDKNGKEDAEDELPQRLEYASKSDYQFQQAINLLKGLQIMQNKAQQFAEQEG